MEYQEALKTIGQLVKDGRLAMDYAQQPFACAAIFPLTISSTQWLAQALAAASAQSPPNNLHQQWQQ